jgi:hypothetical protein
MVRWLLLIGYVLIFSSCDLLGGKEDRTPVARVNDAFLYEVDVTSLINQSISSEDSAVVVSSYINQWATEQLLLDKARINISAEQQEQYNKLVSQYKVSLFTEAYKNALVSLSLDSVISLTELDTLYQKDKANFLLNDDLIKIRYVLLEEGNTNRTQIKRLLSRYSEEDKEELSSLNLQFKSANLNDSVWIKKKLLLARLPVFNKVEAGLYAGKFGELKDSTGIYIYKVEDKLKKGDVTPSTFIAPTLRQIILNKRKLELIKNIEKDITKDAIKNNNFEIYTKE